MNQSWMTCLALLVGLGMEIRPCVGLAKGDAPDFGAYDNLLKNISQHRVAGENVSISALLIQVKSHMHHLTTVLCVMSETCIMKQTCNFIRKNMHYLRKTKVTTLNSNMWRLNK